MSFEEIGLLDISAPISYQQFTPGSDAFNAGCSERIWSAWCTYQASKKNVLGCSSSWMVLGRGEENIPEMKWEDDRLKQRGKPIRIWTDDFSNLLSLIR
jgi:hypothetical protein